MWVLRLLAIAALPLCGLGFLFFLGWAIKAAYAAGGTWVMLAASACTIVTCLGVASLIDMRSGPPR